MLIRNLRNWLYRKLHGIDTSPSDHFREDYETLIRLARRCAYDFAHATDFIKMPPYLSGLDYAERANMWIALFAKGNPGKDYRTKYMLQLSEADSDRKALYKILEENGLADKVNGDMTHRCMTYPF